MPRACTVCSHPERGAIDAAIVAGIPNRRIAARFSVTEQAIRRHAKAHLVERLRAQAAAEAIEAKGLLKQIDDLRAAAMGILAQAYRGGDLKTALQGIAQARSCLELQARLLGQLDERPVVNILVTSEWRRIRDVMVEALRPYPDAARAVAARLAALEAEGGTGA